MRTIYLHGALRKRFAPSFTLAVDTPAEAFRALISQLPDFREAIAKGEWRVIRGRRRGGMAIDERELGLRFGREEEMHILPAPKGRKSGGGGKILIGAVILVAAIFTYGAALGYFGAGAATALGSTAGTTVSGTMAGGALATTAATTWTASAAVSQLAIGAGLMGASMMLQGVSALLSPQPKPNRFLETEQRQSFMFTGPVNSGGQGQVMPLIYGGPIRVGSIVGSAQIRSESVELTTEATTQTYSKSGVLQGAST